ncbi:MAG TPA: 4-alpha-glucanotransferase, partial [Candidatus Binataceae bacterium]|nr:4-alpha-glucanotransferase [Candidatus Binataceae bacterium]
TEIIAEDLGVIPPFVRATLARLAIPGYKVFRWEKEGWGTPHERFLNPASYPEVSLATTGTHDTETLVQWWREISADERARLAQALEFRGHTPSHSPKLSAHTRDLILESLYASPSRLVVVPTQDLFGWTRRINTPGTVNRRNWSWRLPFEIEQATDRPKVRARVEKIRALATRNGRFVPGQA